jgi:hypothetical protein
MTFQKRFVILDTDLDYYGKRGLIEFNVINWTMTDIGNGTGVKVGPYPERVIRTR